MTKAAIIIPARYASTRLPGKPLLDGTGKPLIAHVYERALQAKNASLVVVATDDVRIADVVRASGGVAVMTSHEHETGTMRVAEAASGLDANIIVNLQGDEPEIDPADLDTLIEVQAEGRSFASTLACRFPLDADNGPGSPDDVSAVKVILGEQLGGKARVARTFTRALCAYPRLDDGRIEAPDRYFLHLGVYAFSKKNLQSFANAPQGVLEMKMQLEQMRILEMGEHIAVCEVNAAPPGIDTPEDYAAFVKRYRQQYSQQYSP